ncbi:MAG: hypothetical protein ACOCW2_02105 [Chitinivibrionales bacterium]
MTEASVQMSLPIGALIATKEMIEKTKDSVGPKSRWDNRFMIKGGIVKGHGKARRLFAVGYIRMGGRFRNPVEGASAPVSIEPLPA